MKKKTIHSSSRLHKRERRFFLCSMVVYAVIFLMLSSVSLLIEYMIDAGPYIRLGVYGGVALLSGILTSVVMKSRAIYLLREYIKH